jgi:hypothetical protein
MEALVRDKTVANLVSTPHFAKPPSDLLAVLLEQTLLILLPNLKGDVPGLLEPVRLVAA